MNTHTTDTHHTHTHAWNPCADEAFGSEWKTNKQMHSVQSECRVFNILLFILKAKSLFGSSDCIRNLIPESELHNASLAKC